MAKFLQRVLIGGALLGALAGSAPVLKFYADDPLLRDPKPLPVGKLRVVKFTDSGDFLHNTLLEPGQKQSKSKPTPSLDVNTLDELPDSAWYTNRHYFHRMTLDQLKLGVDGRKPPAVDKPWVIYQAKLEGVTPGFRVEDSTGEKYVFKFDPLDHIEMATGPDVVVARLYHALGYNTPDNYPVRFRREQLKLGDNVKFNRQGHAAIMNEDDLDRLLKKVPRYPDGSYRALASRFITGDVIGPFQYYGTRIDDPNDTIPHERRRVLRGLYVFAAWVSHTDSRAINSLDTIQEVDGVRAVRHYLIDFGATLGSDSLIPKEAWHGHEYYMDLKRGAVALTTLGIYAPDWARKDYDKPPSVGLFDAETFQPDVWKASYPNPAFDNRTIGDSFWAAKQVMAFTDADIRALVATGEYSDPAAAEKIAVALIRRRDKIGKEYFSRVLPLDGFRADAGELKFRDLGGSGKYTIAWSRFDNASGAASPLAGESSFRIPSAGPFLKADLSDGTHKASVYLRNGAVIGVER